MDQIAANGRPMYDVEKTAYTLADAKSVASKDGKTHQVLTVPLVFKTPEGVESD